MIPRIVIEDIVRNQPFVSVIIPTKNNFDLVKQNLESWKRNVTYQEYQILIVDTGSYPSIIQKYESILTPQIRLIRYDYYNFGRINNDVVLNHLDERTELLLFCNDDIVLMNDALTRMVSIYNNRTTSVGTIGCRLHYPNEKIQHNGIFVTRDGKLGHMDYMKSNGYRMDTNYNAIGNTGAFMLTSLELFNKIGGFNPKYEECFEDVEYNLECLLKGKSNITTSEAVCIHYESVSRKKDLNANSKMNSDLVKVLLPYLSKNKTRLKRYLL